MGIPILMIPSISHIPITANSLLNLVHFAAILLGRGLSKDLPPGGQGTKNHQNSRYTTPLKCPSRVRFVYALISQASTFRARIVSFWGFPGMSHQTPKTLLWKITLRDGPPCRNVGVPLRRNADGRLEWTSGCPSHHWREMVANFPLQIDDIEDYRRHATIHTIIKGGAGKPSLTAFRVRVGRRCRRRDAHEAGRLHRSRWPTQVKSHIHQSL